MRQSNFVSAVLAGAVVLALVLVVPRGASAGQARSFGLPSPLVDINAPGGRLADGRTAPKVNVYLPDGFNRKSKKGYPVLYLLHGANGGTDSWIPTFERFFENFKGIVVAPDGGVFGMYVNWWNGGKRAGPAWASYHLGVLRREIERRYPIRKGRRWHAIGGISMGGQGTLRYAAMLPGYFGAAVGLSPAVPDMQSQAAQIGINVLPLAGGAEGVSYDAVFGPPDGYWAEGNSPMALAPNFGHTRIYVTAGDGTNCPQDPETPNLSLDALTESQISAQIEPFADAVRARGADVTAVITCGVHTFGVWDRAIVAARKWGFFRPVAEHPVKWAYRTVAASGDMWGFHFRFAKPSTVVAGLRRNGKRLAASGSGRVRLTGLKCRLNLKLPFKVKLGRKCNPVGKR